MQKNKIIVLSLASIMMLWSYQTNADCISDKIQKIRAEEKPFSSQPIGCDTKGTNRLNGVRDNCDNHICYSAEAGWMIKDRSVDVHNHSQGGDEHSYSPVAYEKNSSGDIERACVDVHAKSSGAPHYGHGWMKVVITGTLQKIISQADLTEIIKQCSGS